jgi:ferritin-like metal-binding protein YciE
MNETKTLEDRIDELENKINVIMSLVNHINQTMSNNVIQNIQDVIDEAVDKKINYMNKNRIVKTSMDGGANRQ